MVSLERAREICDSRRRAVARRVYRIGAQPKNVHPIVVCMEDLRIESPASDER